jgi:frataxin-like iron-binding protein CyaY
MKKLKIFMVLLSLTSFISCQNEEFKDNQDDTIAVYNEDLDEPEVDIDLDDTYNPNLKYYHKGNLILSKDQVELLLKDFSVSFDSEAKTVTILTKEESDKILSNRDSQQKQATVSALMIYRGTAGGKTHFAYNRNGSHEHNLPHWVHNKVHNSSSNLKVIFNAGKNLSSVYVINYSKKDIWFSAKRANNTSYSVKIPKRSKKNIKLDGKKYVSHLLFIK